MATSLYRKDESVRCKGLIWRCRTCNTNFGYMDRTNPCPVCGEDRQCNYTALYPHTRCKNHLKGNYMTPGNTLKHGGRSKYPLMNLAGKYLELKDDAVLNSVRPLMDILDARIVQLLDRVTDEESDQRWKNLLDAFDTFERHYSIPLDGKEREAFNTLKHHFEKAYHDYMSWQDIYKAMEEYRRMAETETKRLKDMNAMMTVEDGMKLTAGLLAAIMEVTRLLINDDHTRASFIQQISTRFVQLTGRGTIIDVEAGSPEADYPEAGAVDFEKFLDS